MRMLHREYSDYDVPELEDSEFALDISPCPQIEDYNDLGEMGDSFSIGLSALDVLGDDIDF